MRCPECGAENPDGTAYCGLCNKSLNYVDPRVQVPPAWNGPGEISNAYASIMPIDRGAGKRSRVNQVIRISVICVIIAAVIGGAAFIAQWFLAGSDLYSSSISGLTFEYPRSWSTFSADDKETLENYGMGYLPGNEINLEGDEEQCILVANSIYIANNLLTEPESFLARSKIEILPDLTAPTSSGCSFANTKFNDVVIDGKFPGVHISGGLFIDTQKIAGREVLITVDRSTVYILDLFFDPDYRGQDVFKDIISSIEFKDIGGEISHPGDQNSSAAPKLVE